MGGGQSITAAHMGDPARFHFGTAFWDGFRERVVAEADRAGPIRGPVAVSYLAEFPIPPEWGAEMRRRAIRRELSPGVETDFRHLTEAVLAVLAGPAIIAPSQAVHLTGRRCYGINPKILVTVQSIGAAITDGGPHEKLRTNRIDHMAAEKVSPAD